MKKCNKCKTEKPLDEFHKRSASKDGKQPFCKKCGAAKEAARYLNPVVRAKFARRYADNRESLIAYQSEYHRNKPHVSWESKYRQRSSGFGFYPTVLSFTRNELLERWGDCCYLCNGAWDQLEHVTPVSSGGEHSLDNCRPVCGPCNRRAWVEYRRSELSRAI